jgi:hypothetical protein
MTVDKILFKSLLHRYASSSPEEAEQVLSLKSQFPYSQLLSALSAKVMTDHGVNGHQQELQAAAVRAADRTVLREVIENEIFFTDETNPSASLSKDHENRVSIESIQVSESIAPTSNNVVKADDVEKKIVRYEVVDTYTDVDGTDLADQVMKDLETLSASRHNFEMLFVEYAEVKAKDVNEANEVVYESSGASDSIREKESSKSRKQRIVEMAKAREAAPSAAVETIEETKKKRNALDGKASPNDELIKEIITTKEEISPENPKQREQIDLINHFIKAQPSITSAKDKQATTVADLNPVKTGEFGDNIVSETLVEILVKQGKKDKAIEVLKKLIWKYPQKKAYFASQIEDLKK